MQRTSPRNHLPPSPCLVKRDELQGPNSKSATESTCFPVSIRYIYDLTYSKTHRFSLWGCYQWNTGEYSLRLDLYTPPPFPSYNTGPHWKIINRWVGWEQLPGESSQVLRQAGIAAVVPRLEGRRQASAWLSQSLRRTRKTWQKSPLPVTFIPEPTHPLAQVWTHKMSNWE